jgi:adenine-specific DNA-methyltransferase
MARPLYRENLDRLQEQNRRGWSSTRKLCDADSFETFDGAFQAIQEQEVTYKEAYGCFISAYGNAYFSLIQAGEIDSIRYALDVLKGRGIITTAQFDWGLLALGHASLRVANTTGHFAQFLTPSETNFTRVIQQFDRSVFDEWINSVAVIQPIGTSEWRKGNTATRSDSETLLRGLGQSSGVGVVYCDPPYTDDQYSRYYHLWETLVLYDYPGVTGQGRYRRGRFTTDFSLRSKVADAFNSLIDQVASTGADLVLSYPSNGLLHEIGGCPLHLLRTKYRRARLAAEIEYTHSTMGASKGVAKATVKERIYVARRA